MDHMLSAVLLSLLITVFIWFVWPMVTGPFSRLNLRRSSVRKDMNEDDLFDVWAKRGASLN